MYLSNIAGLIIVLSTVPLFAAILRIPFAIIAPIIIVVCAIGAYTVHSAMLDIWLMLLFGIVGYVLKKLDYPLAPLVLALVMLLWPVLAFAWRKLRQLLGGAGAGLQP